MSSSETEESIVNDSNVSKRSKFILMKLKEVKKLETDKIFAYIDKLHELLKKNTKRLKKYKTKIKNLQAEALKKSTELNDDGEKANRIEVKPQCTNEVKDDDAETSTAPVINVETTTATVTSFVDEIRQAAEQAQNLNGFVYEPTSGLYYDQKTGYYYNAEYGLYYDGSNGCYYNYNQEKNAFEFHSQVQMPKDPTETKATDDHDDIFEDYDEVEFDEFGVITDAKILRQIKKEKLKNQKKRSKMKKKKSKSKSKKKQVQKSSRKHKRQRRNSKSGDKPTTSDSEYDEEKDGGSSKRRKKKRRQHRDIEDGELSMTSSSSSSCSSSGTNSDTELDDEKETVSNFKHGSRFQDIAKKYPPSLRIIVQESNLDELKVGSLSLITYKGGSLGREGNHDVIIPDLNVSKFHLKFNYDTKKSIYKCIDLGSRNGTILNGTRMCSSKTESGALDLVHGSVLQIGQTKLLCHIHEGNSTCGLCEPGLLIETPLGRESAAVAATTNVLSHKEQLKKLQKKYGLENEKFVGAAGKQNVGGGNYNDRAATRRIKVGSSTDKEKTHTASVNTEIPSENKGFKMLSKLGWSKGEALGKTNASTGLLEPINVASNAGKKGLGCDDVGGIGAIGGVSNAGISMSLSIAEKKKIDTWKRAQARYQKTADIFCMDSDDST